jgi:IPT/TIG domain
VQAGDLVGLNDANASTAPNACIIMTGETGDLFGASTTGTDAADGATITTARVIEGYRLNISATLLEPPTISGITPQVGGTTRGTAVVITGTEFAEVKSVSFGSTAANSYEINSEGQIIAVSPAGAESVPISVTTVAGTATSGQQSAYLRLPPRPRPARSRSSRARA